MRTDNINEQGAREKSGVTVDDKSKGADFGAKPEAPDADDPAAVRPRGGVSVDDRSKGFEPTEHPKA